MNVPQRALLANVGIPRSYAVWAPGVDFSLLTTSFWPVAFLNRVVSCFAVVDGAADDAATPTESSTAITTNGTR